MPQAFPTDRSKIAFMISHLTDRAKAWASAEWGRGSSICNSLTDFQAALTKTFDPELSSLKQGSGSVCDFAIRFRTLAAESGWNDTALYDVFLKGLAAPLQDLLVPLDLPSDVDSLIALAIRTDNRLVQFRRQRGGRPAAPEGPACSTTPSGSANHRSPTEPHPHPRTDREVEPMQLGRARLTPEERRKRQLEGRCFYCGEIGHLVISCPAKGSISFVTVRVPPAFVLCPASATPSSKFVS
ncbi:Retrotransposon-derived protein PEG10 [Merluccius polli]|uniref:Retrotransposon-derived protein PEG10 n=1 Tax=Merluccius polli TaxID=89951 RepID=A0AA47MPM5_MERPO|nr:Retrotransposon-derived protein PEG10 [Merluccius polli]